MKKPINNLVYNQPYLKTTRKKLRKQKITAEKILWIYIRNKQRGYKFRRQFSIGNYILDFYCPKLKLGIEVDGATHSEKLEIKRDNEKEKFINKFGIKIIRYINVDVFKNINSVLEDLEHRCKIREEELKNRPHPSPLLSKERG